jgi:hypothetical protein
MERYLLFCQAGHAQNASEQAAGSFNSIEACIAKAREVDGHDFVILDLELRRWVQI